MVVTYLCKDQIRLAEESDQRQKALGDLLHLQINDYSSSLFIRSDPFSPEEAACSSYLSYAKRFSLCINIVIHFILLMV